MDVNDPKHVFSVIGDSNVQRNLVDSNCGSREDMRQAQIIPCTSLSTFSGCLAKVSSEATVLILSCVSNFLRDSSSSSDPTSRMTSTLETFRDLLLHYCESNPDLSVMLAPPQYSKTPTWYADSGTLPLQLVRKLVIDEFPVSNLFLIPAQQHQVCKACTFSI